MADHVPVLPVYDQESFSHVSLPNSPGCGMLWKIQSRLPVRTSKPRTYPFTFSFVFGTPPERCAAPTTTTLLPTTGGALIPIEPVSGSTTWSSCVLRSTTPLVPKEGTGTPVFAFSATRLYPGVIVKIRSSPCPSLQYATPRPDPGRTAFSPRFPSSIRHSHNVSPVAASSATTSRRVPACV